MANTSVQFALGKKKLADDLRLLVADTEELLRLTGGASNTGIDALRTRVEDHIATARAALSGTHGNVMARGRVAVDNADGFVRDKPWQAMAVGVGVGVLLGVLAARS